MIELSVQGMTCGHCVSAVTRAVKTVDPEADVQVDLGTGKVRVDGHGSAEALGKAITEAGYPAALAGGQSASAARKKGGCCAA